MMGLEMYLIVALTFMIILASWVVHLLKNEQDELSNALSKIAKLNNDNVYLEKKLEHLAIERDQFRVDAKQLREHIYHIKTVVDGSK